MSLEDTQRAAALHIPQAERVIIGSRERAAPITTELHVQDTIRMSLEDAQRAAALHVPQAQRAVIAARGVFGTFLGPWSAGSALVLLIRAAGDPHPSGAASFAAGGMGAVTQAMASAAKAAGVEIRTGSEVIEIHVKNGAATGILLSTGEEIFPVHGMDRGRTAPPSANTSLFAQS